MFRAIRVGLMAMVFSVVTAFAADLELKPLGFELTGQSEPQMVQSVSASEKELKFFYSVSGSAEKTLTATWIAEDVGEAAPPETIITDPITVTLSSAENQAKFSLSQPDAGWPVGKYRLEVRQGDTLLHTQKFDIVAP